MKVVINAASAKMGGAANYLGHLLRHLSSLARDSQFLVFLPPETIEKVEAVSDNIQLLPTRVGHRGWWRRVWWEQVTLRRFLKKQSADLLFSTANFGMFCCPVRQLLLVRNALYFSKIYQEMFLGKHSLRTKVSFGFRRWLICRSARSADRVLTPTRAMLDDLRRFVKVGPEKALVNPYGVTAQDSLPGLVCTPTGGPSRKADQAIRLVYVSLYSEHKNLSTLLKALPLLNDNDGGKFFLKTTADPNWMNWAVTYKSDLALAHQPEVGRWVEFVGPLGAQQTQKLYQAADIFVFPSLVESFGHPMVEAMAHGLPIVASDTLVNREVCGDAALYFSPLSPEHLARQVRRLAMDSTLWATLSAGGRQRASTQFRWNEHVRRILEAVTDSVWSCDSRDNRDGPARLGKSEVRNH